jgi:hypothetical protein
MGCWCYYVLTRHQMHKQTARYEELLFFLVQLGA